MKRVILLLLAICMLCSCSHESTDSYVDEQKTKEKYDVQMNQKKAEDISIDDKAKVILSDHSISSDHIIICEHDSKKKIDLNTGIISSLCDIPGCAHDINDPRGCTEYQPINGPICTSDGMYYTNYSEPGKLYYKTSDGERVVFQNDFFTEKEAEIDPDAKTAFSVFVHADVMYITGQVYFYTVDIHTMKQTCDPVVLTDSPIWNADADDEYFYITNENLELIRYNMKSKQTDKLDDKVWRIQATANGLYYIKTDGEDRSVYFIKKGESEAVKLISDAMLDMYVTDAGIYYAAKDGIYKASLDASQSIKLELKLSYENGEKYETADHGRLKLISCSSAKNVYVLDYTKLTGEKCYNALFCIDKQTDDCKAVSLGIWFQPVGGKQEIISY